MLIKKNDKMIFRLAWLNAILVVVASLGGIFFHSYLYDPDPYTLPQLIAQDYVTLLLGVPLLVAGILLTQRGSMRGWLLLTGGLGYMLYGYFFFVVGVRFNILFLVYIGIFASSLYALIVLLANSNIEMIVERLQGRIRYKLIAGFLVASGALFALMWVSQIVLGLTTGVGIDPVARQVYVIDLGALLPALIFTGILLWRGKRWGYALSGMLLVKVATLCIMLVVSSTFMYFAGQALEVELVVSFSAVALFATLLTLNVLKATKYREE